MDKSEAMKRLDAIEAEAKELRRIIEEPALDYSEWVGSWGFYSDTNPSCPGGAILGKLSAYNCADYCPFEIGNAGFRYFRPATAEELGFTIEPDWSKAPEWAMWWARDADGQAAWYKDSPYRDKLYWLRSGMYERDNLYLPNWRDTLRKRPE